MEQARIEHAPNESLQTYITSADALVNNIKENISYHKMYGLSAQQYSLILTIYIYMAHNIFWVVTQPACSLEPLSAHQQNAICMAFSAGGPIVTRF